jgi:hypothetical protein
VSGIFQQLDGFLEPDSDTTTKSLTILDGVRIEMKEILSHRLHTLFHSNFLICMDRSLVCSIHVSTDHSKLRGEMALALLWLEPFHKTP